MVKKNFNCECNCFDCTTCKECCKKSKVYSNRKRGLGPVQAFKEGKRGLRGYQGVPGTPGPIGMDGLDGDQGAQGAQGPTGLQGSPGTAGTTGSFDTNICDLFTVPYSGVCTRTFTFIDVGCPTPSLFTMFEGVCVGTNVHNFAPPLSFAQLNDFLESTYNISYQGNDIYTCQLPNLEASGLSIKPFGYVDPDSNPINSLVSTTSDEFSSFLLCGESGPGFVRCDQLAESLMVQSGTTGATGPTGLHGPTGPAGPTGPTGMNVQFKCTEIAYRGLSGDTEAERPLTGADGDYFLVRNAGGDLSRYDGSDWVAINSPMGEEFLFLDTATWQIWSDQIGSGVPSVTFESICPLIPGDYLLDGVSGDLLIYGPTGFQETACNLGGVTGLQGPAGLQGEVGPTGFQGSTGLQGPTGLVGPIGPTGLQGSTGVDGATGAQGSSGDRGSSAQCGDVFSGLTAADDASKPLPPPPGTEEGDFCLTLNTGVLFRWDGATWEIVNPQPHPFFYFDINSTLIYDVQVAGPPGPDPVDAVSGDLIISEDGSGDLFIYGATGWHNCDLNGDLCVRLNETQIDCLGDVNVTGASENDYLCYDGSNWVPQSVFDTWTSFTPVFRATTTDPTVGTNTASAFFVVDGSTMEIKLLYTQTGVGNPGIGDYRLELPLPGTFNINTTVSPALSVLGHSEIQEGTGGGAVEGHGQVRVVDATLVEVNTSSESDSVLDLWSPSRFTFGATDLRVSMSFRVPIVRL